jgi:hypothetical protein
MWPLKLVLIHEQSAFSLPILDVHPPLSNTNYILCLAMAVRPLFLWFVLGLTHFTRLEQWFEGKCFV